jgi:hypothetical protein
MAKIADTIKSIISSEDDTAASKAHDALMLARKRHDDINANIDKTSARITQLAGDLEGFAFQAVSDGDNKSYSQAEKGLADAKTELEMLQRARRAAIKGLNDAEEEFTRRNLNKQIAAIKRKNNARNKSGEAVVKAADDLGKAWASFCHESDGLVRVLPPDIANHGGTMLRISECLDALSRQLRKSNPSEPTMPNQVPSFPEPAYHIGNPAKIVPFDEMVRTASDFIVRLMSQPKVVPQPEPLEATPVVAASEVQVPTVVLNEVVPPPAQARTYTAAEAAATLGRPRIDLSTLPQD